jgi:hypothetical protein
VRPGSETGWHGMRQPGRGGRSRPRPLGAWPRGTAGASPSLPVRAALAGTHRAGVRPGPGVTGSAHHSPTPHARSAAETPATLLQQSQPATTCIWPELLRDATIPPDVIANRPFGLMLARSCVLLARMGRSATRRLGVANVGEE